MKQFWVCVAISIVVVIALVMWVAKASEKYAEDHPELAAQAKQSVEGYNEAVEKHNERVRTGQTETE